LLTEEEKKQRHRENNKRYNDKHPERGKQYYKKNKKRILARAKKYRENNKERISQVCKIWREKNKEYLKEYRQKNKKRRRETTRIWDSKHKKEYHQKHKRLAIAHYSNNTNKCECCGENAFEFLTFDHINGGGNKHRKNNKIWNLAVWLVKNDYPEGFRILCFNCNCSIGHCGYCPHQKKKAKKKSKN